MSGRFRRHGGQLLMACVSACVLTSAPLFGANTFVPYEAAEVPQNVTDLWRDYDARKEALEVRVVWEWKAEGVVTRYVTFKVDLSSREGQRILSRIRMVDAH